MNLKSKIIDICVLTFSFNLINETVSLSNRTKNENNVQRVTSSSTKKRKISLNNNPNKKKIKTQNDAVFSEEYTLYNFLKNINNNKSKTQEDYIKLNKLFRLLFIYKYNNLIPIEIIDPHQLENDEYVMTIVGNIYYHEFLKPYIVDKIINVNLEKRKNKNIPNSSSSNSSPNILIKNMIETMFTIDNSTFNSILDRDILINDPLRLLKVILISWNMYSSKTFKFL